MHSIARKIFSLSSVHHLLQLSSLSSPNYPFYSPPLSPPSLAVAVAAANPLFTLARLFSSQPSSPYPFAVSFIRSGFHEDDNPRLPSFPFCPGCGVRLQDSDSALPGFFSLPSPKSPDYRAPLSPTPDPQIPISLKSGLLQEPEQENPNPNLSESSDEHTKHFVCSRCHSLRHYGRVKFPSADNLLTDFNFHRMLSPMMSSGSGPRSIVLLVVDAADFDGSFPRKVARLFSSSIDVNARAWKENMPANVPRIVLVVTKVDLLPPLVSLTRLEQWARHRAQVSGAAKLSGVHLVSAVRDWGVKNLVEQVAELAGSRGNVWAVGAQNAGKSTLINAMGRCVGQMNTQLTEAPMPGTTLGIVRVEGVLCGQSKLFDTPGILHPFQITTRLTREEQKLVHMSKELKPRTYRIKAGHSVHIGGLMRLDVEESSADTIYLTVWASPLLPLHMGKKENSCRIMEDHFGLQLQPPIGEGRIRELGKWVRSEFRIRGNSWTESSTDIAAAGLGWVAVCLDGEAVLGVWTYHGIGIVARKSLITRKAHLFEKAGFTVSKIVSQADSKFNKEKRN